MLSALYLYGMQALLLLSLSRIIVFFHFFIQSVIQLDSGNLFLPHPVLCIGDKQIYKTAVLVLKKPFGGEVKKSYNFQCPKRGAQQCQNPGLLVVKLLLCLTTTNSKKMWCVLVKSIGSLELDSVVGILAIPFLPWTKIKPF